MSVENLLSRLAKVKPTGRGTWIACCPAHEDRSPSMTVRDCDDGRVLVHCFAGCSVHDILGAVGMDIAELFPPKPIEHAKPIRRPFPAADVLEALAMESLIVLYFAKEARAGNPIDHPRLVKSIGRIEAGRQLALDSPPDMQKVRRAPAVVDADLAPGNPHIPLPTLMQVPQ